MVLDFVLQGMASQIPEFSPCSFFRPKIKVVLMTRFDSSWGPWARRETVSICIMGDECSSCALCSRGSRKGKTDGDGIELVSPLEACLAKAQTADTNVRH